MKLLILFDSPAKEKDQNNYDYKQRQARELALRAGIPFHRLSFGYLFPAYIPFSEEISYWSKTNHLYKSEKEIVALEELITSQDPNVIVTMGDVCFTLLTGFQAPTFRGTLVKTKSLKHKNTNQPFKIMAGIKADIINASPKEKNVASFHFRKLINHLNEQIFDAETDQILSLLEMLPINKETSPLKFLFPKTFPEIIETLEKLEKQTTYSFDTETTNNYITHFGFSWMEESTYFATSFSLTTKNEKKFTVEEEVIIISKLLNIFSKKENLCIAQNIQYDMTVLLKNYHIIIENELFDTMVAAHIMPKVCEFPKSLQLLSSMLLDTPAWKHASKDDHFLYNALDALNTLKLYQWFQNNFTPIDRQFMKLEMDLLEILAFLGWQGMKVDKDKLKTLKETNNNKLTSYEEILRALLPETITTTNTKESKQIKKKDFNFNSSQQMCCLLYDTWKLPQQKEFDRKIKKMKITANEEALLTLQRLFPTNQFLTTFTQYKQTFKIISTYLNLVTSPIGKVHTSYNVRDKEDENMGTMTARLTSGSNIIFPYGNQSKEGGKVSMNLQNQPESVRSMFIPDEEDFCIVGLDLVQAENVIVAHESMNEYNINAFKNNFGKSKKDPSYIDLHKVSASLCFNIPVQQVTPEQRQTGKHVVHSGNYDSHAIVLQSILLKVGGVYTPIETCQDLIKSLHKKNPCLPIWHKTIQEKVMNTGKLTNHFGRTHYFYDRLLNNKGNFDLKSCYAYIPQSTVADYINIAMVDFYKKYGDSPNYSIWSQLHDAVYFTCKNSHVEELVAKCRECFTIPITDPNTKEPYYIDLEFKKGTSWGDMKEIK